MIKFWNIIRENRYRAKWICGITLIATLPSFFLSLFIIHTISNGRIHDLEKNGDKVASLLQGFLVEEFVYYDYRGLIQKANYLYNYQSLAYLQLLDKDNNNIYSIPKDVGTSVKENCINKEVSIKSKNGQFMGSVLFGIDASEAQRAKTVYLTLLLLVSFISTALIVLALYIAIRALLIPYNEILLHLSKTAKGSYASFSKYVKANDERKHISEHINKVITDISVFQKESIDNSTYKAIAFTTQNIAHDLKSPINVINQTLNSNSWADFTQRKPVTTSAMLRLQGMVDSFKNADLEGVVKNNWGAIPWDGIINEMRSLAEERGIVLHVEDVYRGSVYLDIPKIERVIINLLKNAIEADSKNIWLSGKVNGMDLAIQIEDDGSGVPEEFVPYLFTKGKTLNKADGTGLGLSFVKKTANGHGGDASYERQDSRSVFGITLPKAVKEGKDEADREQEMFRIELKQLAGEPQKEEEFVTGIQKREVFSKVTVKHSNEQLEQKVIESLVKQYPTVAFSNSLDGSSFVWTNDHELIKGAITKKIPIHMLSDKETPEALVKTISNKLQYFT